MKVERTVAVALLVSLGFAQAGSLPNDKVVTKLRLVPTKVKEDKILEEHKGLYNDLKDLGAAPLVLEGEAPASEKPVKTAKAKLAAKPAKAKEAKKEKTPKAEKPAKKLVEKDAFGYRMTCNRSKVLAALNAKTGSSLEAVVKASGAGEKSAVLVLGWAARQGLVVVEKTVAYRLAPAK